MAMRWFRQNQRNNLNKPWLIGLDGFGVEPFFLQAALRYYSRLEGSELLFIRSQCLQILPTPETSATKWSSISDLSLLTLNPQSVSELFFMTM